MGNRTNGGLLPGLVFTFLCFVWGSTWLAIKVGLGSLPPITFAGIRFVIASCLLASYAIARRTEFPRDANSWRVMLFLSLSQIAVPYALAFWGEQYMTAGLTSLLFATLPFFVVVFAHFMIPGEECEDQSRQKASIRPVPHSQLLYSGDSLRYILHLEIVSPTFQ